ncbi:MAG: sodium:solute symporter family protein [Rhodothermales bacterium]
MQLGSLDWFVIVIYGIITLTLGFWFTGRAGKSMEDYFVAGRTLPWWLAGTSIAATWFATDAPLAAASLVRQQGIFGNWLWWYEGAGVMFLVFFYAKLWRRAEVITDAEFIELRYSGRSASALRAFTAIFMGVLKNCVVMGWVMLAMIKFSQVLLGWDAELTLVVCIFLALTYTVASGLWGVVTTDMFQFVAGMIGSMILAGIVLAKLGGPAEMAAAIQALPDAKAGVLDLTPNADHISPLEFSSFLILIFFLWTRSGQGDGYLAQRLFATRDEKQSMLAALWFCFAGIVLMTWPWIIVGLGSLIILPVESAIPALAADPELAYPMMIAELMPAGLKGLLVASFLAAFMSTMDTHLCWGGSYLVADIYRRFMYKEGTERHYVLASRIAVLVLVMVAALVAWQMSSIERAWIYVIEITAGIALVWLLRWYWWRVNAWSEISAMIGSLVIANGYFIASGLSKIGIISAGTLESFSVFYGSEFDMVRALVILITCTLIWITVTFMTPADDEETLERFYRRVRPGGWWGPIAERNPDIKPDSTSGQRWMGWFLGILFLYASLLGIGHIAIGNTLAGIVLLVLSLAAAWGTLKLARTSYSTQ